MLEANKYYIICIDVTHRLAAIWLLDDHTFAMCIPFAHWAHLFSRRAKSAGSRLSKGPAKGARLMEAINFVNWINCVLECWIIYVLCDGVGISRSRMNSVRAQLVIHHLCRASHSGVNKVYIETRDSWTKFNACLHCQMTGQRCRRII